MQNIVIYQAANNTSNLEAPLYSDGEGKKDEHYPWLLPGYYFWEHNIEDAKVWGRKRYNDDYSIYSCSYNMDDQYCLDLVSNYRHRDFFFKVRERLIKKGKGGNVRIEMIIKWILDNQTEDTYFKCARLESKTFSPMRIEVPTPNDKVIFHNSTVQVCFYEFPNDLIVSPFKLEEKHPKSPVFG